MTSLKRIHSVAEAVRAKADDAARTLAQIQQRATREQAKLDELVAYRNEYSERFSLLGRQGLAALQAYGLNQFLRKIDHAIGQQQAILARVSNDQETSRQEWLSRERRAKSIDKVVARHRQRERSSQERREQRETDASARLCSARKAC